MMIFHSLGLEEQGLRCNSEPGRALFYKLGLRFRVPRDFRALGFRA